MSIVSPIGSRERRCSSPSAATESVAPVCRSTESSPGSSRRSREHPAAQRPLASPSCPPPHPPACESSPSESRRGSNSSSRWNLRGGATLDEDLTEPMAEIGRLVLTGGKRLRPAFCQWGYVGLGGNADDAIITDAGAAFELMHAFALFHDDVMDDADSRRGRTTTHTVFARKHAESDWAGEARRFGEGVAILIGDLAFVYSDMLLADATPAAWRVWNELRIELNVGQVLDMLGSGARRQVCCPGRAHLPIQVRQVHHRTSSPPWCRAGSTRPVRRGRSASERLRAAAR